MVKWASHTSAAASKDVCVDHRGTDVFMPKEILDGSDVIAVLKEVCGEAVTEGVARDTLLYLRRTGSLLDRSLQGAWIRMVAAKLAGAGVPG